MPLLDDIIETATDDKLPIGNLLRKCLVLEQTFHNEKFKAWLNNELDGYDNVEAEIPSYRKFNAVSYGFFVGIMGRQINNQPLSLHILDKVDRDRMNVVSLTQPASSYEGRPNKTDDAQLPWNPTMTTKYQGSFFKDSDFVLNRAWQLIPGSVLVSLLETVRNRVLRFALELKDQIGPSVPSVENIPSSTIERSVVNHIYGGNIVIASHAEHTSQISQTNITEGDTAALETALSNLGISSEGIAALRADMTADKSSGQETIGARTKGWLKDIGKYLGKEGAKAGFEVAKQTATRWLLQHYGLLPPG
jgi:hypothetical protein